MTEQISTILGALGSLTNMLNVYINYRKAHHEIKQAEREEMLRVATQGEFAAKADQGAAAAISRMVISKRLLDALNERVVNADKRFSDAVADIRYTPAQIDQEAKIAGAEICAALQIIKDHNDGALPEGELEDFWNAFRCNEDK